MSDKTLLLPRLATWVALAAGLTSFILGLAGVVAPSLDFSGLPSNIWLNSSVIALVLGLIAAIFGRGLFRKLAVISAALGLIGFLVIVFYYGI